MRTWTSLLLVACGPAVDVPQDAGGATTSGTDGSEGSTSGPTSTTTTVGPSTMPPDPVTTFGTASTGSLDSTGTETGASSSTGEDACGPIDDLVAMARLDNGGAFGASTLACTIEGVELGPVEHEIAMMCEGVSHSLRIITPSAPAVPTRGEVVLDVHFTAPGFSDALVVKLTTTDGALILAASTSAAVAGDGLVEPDFFAPLSVAVNSGICEAQELPGGDFIGPCYAYERESITFGLHGDEVTVLDHNRDAFGGTYEAVVEIAERRLDNICDDTEHWYQWVVYDPLPE